MRKPVEENSSLQQMIKRVAVVQLGSTIFLSLLALFLRVSTVTYNGAWVSIKTSMLVLLIQCVCSFLLLKSLSKSVLRRKAWLIWFASWGIGQINVISYGSYMNVKLALSIFQIPLALVSFILIIMTHSYIKRVRTVWD